MNNRFRAGMTAWIVESNYKKREVIITKISSSGVVVKFKDTGGAIRVAKSRLFEDEVAADIHIEKFSGTAFRIDIAKRKKNQYDYM